jgi:hypothetical protein
MNFEDYQINLKILYLIGPSMSDSFWPVKFKIYVFLIGSPMNDLF